jgi:hypothetical protein
MRLLLNTTASATNSSEEQLQKNICSLRRMKPKWVESTLTTAQKVLMAAWVETSNLSNPPPGRYIRNLNEADLQPGGASHSLDGRDDTTRLPVTKSWHMEKIKLGEDDCCWAKHACSDSD